ncbi:MAG: hypothetical protein GX063_07225 [Firmicutes bacterium]|nr:hypothetical protein [Bacillota bacterium]
MAEITSIFTATVMGFLARLYMLRTDYRQYPSYPQGYVIHLSIGLMASFLGAVAVPALLAKNYEAATFLALAATQFREVRKIERETLSSLEPLELIPRGNAYIEGIARVFEARNYLAGGTALFTSIVCLGLSRYWPPSTAVIGGAAGGFLATWFLNRMMVGLKIGDIAHVRSAAVHFDGPYLMVDDVVIMNVGLEESRKRILQEGIGVMIEPMDPDSKATLANLGQRQAILHDVSSLLGIQVDVGEPEFVPLLRRHSKTGALAMVIVPAEKNTEALLEAVRRTPVLEASIRRPLAARAGRLADSHRE